MGKKSRLKRLRNFGLASADRGSTDRRSEAILKIKEPDQVKQSNNRLVFFTVPILIILVLAVLGFSIFRSGDMPSGHDVAAHMFRSKVFHTALSQAQFPVRWVEWIYPGLSAPLFIF